MVDNLFTLAAAQAARQEVSTSSDFLADPDFVAGANLDPAKSYTFDELRNEYASWHKARELAEQDAEEDDDVERDFSKCSYDLGYIKQEVFGCGTCAVEGGLCVCCYNSCHEGHDLFPVDPKRHFRCDCPTATFPTASCSLAADAGTQLATIFAGASKLPPNAENRYGQNFGNLFCWCSTPYGDERFAAETMIQCVVCEEWYHETHLNLKQPSRVPLPLNLNPDDPSAPGVLLRDGEYAALVCESCVLAEEHAPLADYYGLPRFAGLVAGEGGKWDRDGFVEGVEDEEDTDDEGAGTGPSETPALQPTVGQSQASPESEPSKRPLPSSPSAAPSAKKARMSPSASKCTLSAAARDSRAVALLERRKTASAGHNGWGTGRCDLFVQPGFRRDLCRCDVHAPLIDMLPALFGRPEETWQPPPLAIPSFAARPPPGRALTEAELMPLLTSTFGHQRAVDGVQHALSGMADFGRALGKYIEGLGSPGTDVTVTKEDVERFTREYKAKIEEEKAAARGRI